jgi:hypothetical protein
MASVRYGLFTVYPFIRKGQNHDRDFIDNVHRYFNHAIMDSGLFTLMFGAEKGKKTAAFMDEWIEKLIGFVEGTGFRGTCVEVDCQKILGVKKAWEYREKLKRALPNNRQINVFHIDDGPAGLDRMIEFSDYIAISVPELRATGKKQYTERLAHYIKNRKPEIDIHLLGCTEGKLLRALRFCTTSDSTSWKQSSRWGLIDFVIDGEIVKTASKFRPNSGNKKRICFDRLVELNCRRVAKHFGQTDLKSTTVHNLTIDYICAVEALKIYNLYAGDQS